MAYVAEQAPDVDAIVVNGMPNFRRADGLPQRIVSLDRALEAAIGKPIVSSDTALYWRIYKSLGTAPIGQHGQLLSSLR
jgi:maleate cis-trans isomerase